MVSPKHEEQKSSLGGEPPRRSWGWNASVVVAAASVAVALVYNAVQARDSARQVATGRRALEVTARANQFSTLMELNQRIISAQQQTEHALLALRARQKRVGHIGNTPRALTDLLQAVTPLEGTAYLLNHNMTGIPHATDLWRRYLVCAFYTARSGVGPTLDSYVPALARFATAQRLKLGNDHRCALVVP